MRLLFLSIFSILSFHTSLGSAQEIPTPNDEPAVRHPLSLDHFENITKILHAGKLAPHLKCDLKVRTIREERKFSDGKKIVEVLEVTYYPRGIYSDFKVKVMIPAELAAFGSKHVSNHWSGSGEDIKIEAQDSYDHWLRFIHDGKGGLVYFNMGNRLATYPCLMKSH